MFLFCFELSHEMKNNNNNYREQEKNEMRKKYIAVNPRKRKRLKQWAAQIANDTRNRKKTKITWQTYRDPFAMIFVACIFANRVDKKLTEGKQCRQHTTQSQMKNRGKKYARERENRIVCRLKSWTTHIEQICELW